MKKLSLFLFVALSFLFASCEKLSELLSFEIKHSQTFTMPAQFILPGTDFPGSPVAVTTNSSESFKNNNTRAELVKDVTLKKLVLTIQNPDNEDFGFLKDVEVYINSDEVNKEVKLAYLNNISANAGKTLELTATNEKLDQYLKASSFTIRTRATVDEAVSQDVTIKTDMTFKITADPL
jgi:hypothetical protein